METFRESFTQRFWLQKLLTQWFWQEFCFLHFCPKLLSKRWQEQNRSTNNQVNNSIKVDLNVTIVNWDNILNKNVIWLKPLVQQLVADQVFSFLSATSLEGTTLDRTIHGSRWREKAQRKWILGHTYHFSDNATNGKFFPLSDRLSRCKFCPSN